MFDRRKLTERFLDAVDLVIDFATLGEYGLEPVPATAARCREERRRPTTCTQRPPRMAAAGAAVRV